MLTVNRQSSGLPYISRLQGSQAGLQASVHFSGSLQPDDFRYSGTPLARQLKRFEQWAAIKAVKLPQEAPDWKFIVPRIQPVEKPDSPAWEKETRDTLDLYHRLFRSFLWTGEECGNPINLDHKARDKDPASLKEERWDQLAMLNLNEPKISS